jgi:Flp pilus assembly protein TadD
VAGFVLFVFITRVFLPFQMSEALLESAAGHLRDDNLALAASRVNIALDSDPRNADAYVLLGRIYETAAFTEEADPANFEKSWKAYQQAAEIDCLNRGALEGLVRLSMARGGSQLLAAESLIIRLIGIYPTNSRYYILAGQVNERRGLYFDASVDYRRALEIDEYVEQHGVQLSDEEREQVQRAITRTERAFRESVSGGD